MGLYYSQKRCRCQDKSTSTPYKMLKMGRDINRDKNWLDSKKKLEEAYSPIAIEVHTASGFT